MQNRWASKCDCEDDVQEVMQQAASSMSDVCALVANSLCCYFAFFLQILKQKGDCSHK